MVGVCGRVLPCVRPLDAAWLRRGPFMRRQKSSGELDWGGGIRRFPAFGHPAVCRARFGTSCRIGRATAHGPTFYPVGCRQPAGSVPRSRLLRAQRPEGGARLYVGVFQPGPQSATYHPAQPQPRPAGLDRQTSCRSGELGARRHETGLIEPPEGDEQRAGERHDHHAAASSAPLAVIAVIASWRVGGSSNATAARGRPRPRRARSSMRPSCR